MLNLQPLALMAPEIIQTDGQIHLTQKYPLKQSLGIFCSVNFV